MTASPQSPPLTLVFIPGWGASCQSWSLLESHFMADTSPMNVHVQHIDLFDYVSILDDVNDGFVNDDVVSINTVSIDTVKINTVNTDIVDKQKTANPSTFGVNLPVLIKRIAADIPDHSIIIGWSLGGMIATQLAYFHPVKVSRLITMASNVQFVASSSWASAMSPLMFNQFHQEFLKDPLKTQKRFISLQVMGDQYRQRVTQELKSYAIVCSDEVIQKKMAVLLNTLHEINNASCIENMKQPYLAMFGDMDALVPISAAHDLQHVMTKTNLCVEIIRSCGHAFHLSKDQLVYDQIMAFLLKHNVDDKNTHTGSLIGEDKK